MLQTIFDGPKTSSGQRIYASFPYDAGFGSSGVPAWEYVAAMDRDSGALGFIWQIPPANPVGFSGVTYALTTDIDALYANLFTSNGTYTQSAMSRPIAEAASPAHEDLRPRQPHRTLLRDGSRQGGLGAQAPQQANRRAAVAQGQAVQL